jgi:hypothetical protein
MEKLKICSTCKVAKNLECFHKESRRKDGLRLNCKSCQSVAAKSYRTDNKESVAKMKADWYVKNRESEIKKRKLKRRSNPEVQMLALAKHRAKRDGIPFDIELADIHIPEYCPVLKIKIQVAMKNSEDYSPSLDKIVPELGYVKGNIQVISRLANLMKNSASLEQLVLFSEWVTRDIKPLIESKNEQ